MKEDGIASVHSEVTMATARLYERRRYPRFNLSFPAELIPLQQQYGIKGETNDVSLSGFYFRTMLPLAVGTELQVRLALADEFITCKAVVRTADPGVGNGCEFLEISDADKEILARKLAKCAEQLAPVEQASFSLALTQTSRTVI